MADVLTPTQRSRCMAAIRGRDTNPELFVRRLVYSMGYRYRLNVRELPGRPDLVFRAKKKAIFVHGCFWHRHSCAAGQVMPKTRRDFWRTKLTNNSSRDLRNLRALNADGWQCLVLWECELRDEKVAGRAIKRFLDKPHVA